MKFIQPILKYDKKEDKPMSRKRTVYSTKLSKSILLNKPSIESYLKDKNNQLFSSSEKNFSIFLKKLGI